MNRAGTELPTVMSVSEAAALLGISRNSAYEAVRSGELPALRFGRSIRIPGAALNRLLSSSSAAPSPETLTVHEEGLYVAETR